MYTMKNKYTYLIIGALFVFGLMLCIVPLSYKYFVLRAKYDVDEQIFKKDSLLRKKAIIERDKMFVHKDFDVYPLYKNCKPKYQLNNKALKYYFGNKRSQNYKDVVALYNFNFNKLLTPRNDLQEHICMELRVQNTNNENCKPVDGANWNGIWQTGWALGIKRKWDNGYIKYVVMPHAVGFRKQENSFMYDYMNIEEALSEAYDFYTKNKKSNFSDNFVPTNKNFLYDTAYENEYYKFERTDHGLDIMSSWPYCNFFSNWMYDGLYYVFIVCPTGVIHYDLIYKSEQVEADKKGMMNIKKKKLILFIVLTEFVIAIVVVMLSCKFIKDSKYNNLSLLEKIKMETNPQKYIKNYDAERVRIANEIFNEAINTSADDMNKILLLAAKAEQKLNLSFVSATEISRLMKISNPNKYMKPYNADKVKIANEIYARLQKKLSMEDYLKIKEKICSLIHE